MAATRQDLESWFEAGVADGKGYMVVICDTFDHEDYPCYFDDHDAAKSKASCPGEMQRTMEVYDLKSDMGEQMNMRRAWAVK